MNVKVFSASCLAIALAACGADGFDVQVDKHVQSWAQSNGCAKVEDFKRTDITKGNVGKSLTGEAYRNRFEAIVADYAYVCVKADGAKENANASTLMYRHSSTAEQFGTVVPGAEKDKIETLKTTTDFKKEG